MPTIRIRFIKTGDAAYISLLDLQRAMGRCLRRSGVPVWYTEGFNPHIYMTFTCPLPLGQESLAECVDVKTRDEVPDLDRWRQALKPVLPRGIAVTAVAPVVHKAEEVALAGYRIVTEDPAGKRAVEQYNRAESLPVEKKTKRGSRTVDLKQIVSRIEGIQTDDGFCFTLLLPAGGENNINPALLLNAWQAQYGCPAEVWSILRTGLYLKDGREFC